MSNRKKYLRGENLHLTPKTFSLTHDSTPPGLWVWWYESHPRATNTSGVSCLGLSSIEPRRGSHCGTLTSSPLPTSLIETSLLLRRAGLTKTPCKLIRDEYCMGISSFSFLSLAETEDAVYGSETAIETIWAVLPETLFIISSTSFLSPKSSFVTV